MPLFTITRIDGSVIWSGEAESFCKAVEQNKYNLDNANLTSANLAYANLAYANLSATCLDPLASIPILSVQELSAAGLELKDGWVYGYRTGVSSHLRPGITYIVGQTYAAPVFSVAPASCHPGIYLAGMEWLENNLPGVALVRVRCLLSDLHHAGDKWRCRKLEVLAYV